MAEPTNSSTAPAVSSHEPTTDPIVPEDDAHTGSGPDLFDVASEAGSSTNSLSSSVLNYQYENGRRYHAYREGEYVMPNDEREQERLDLHHHVYRLALGGSLFRAPIGLDPRRILDIGTGTGIWAINMADDFPSATVIGTDLSPIQPGFVPPNCYFELDDFESPWEYSRPFDFIHGRSLAGSIRDSTKLFGRALMNLNPGGWFELVDIAAQFYCDDDTIEMAPNALKLVDLVDEASVKFGKRMNIPHNYKQWMIDAGFKNVTEDIYKVPISPWAKDPKMKQMGLYQLANMLDGLESFSLALLTRFLGWDVIEVQLLLAEVRKEIQSRKIHLYGKLYFVYGQREVVQGESEKEEGQK